MQILGAEGRNEAATPPPPTHCSIPDWEKKDGGDGQAEEEGTGLEKEDRGGEGPGERSPESTEMLLPGHRDSRRAGKGRRGSREPLVGRHGAGAKDAISTGEVRLMDT